MKIITAVLSLSLITGCATILSESNYPVTINSSPVANFTITNSDGIKIHAGITPSTVTLKSGDGFFSSASYTIVFKKAGFFEKTTAIEGTLDGWYLGNVLFGGLGLIGILIIDPATGAMWKLPKITSVSLDKNTSSSLSTKKLKIVLIDSLSYEDRANLIPIK